MDSLISLLVGFAIGILFYMWDNKKGYVWYKRWYDLSHKSPLEKLNHYSFINNQPFSKRVIPAIILTALFSYGTWLLGDLNPIESLLTGVVSLIGVLAGFYVGPFALKTLPKSWREANKTLKKIDKLEQDLLNKTESKKEPTPEKIEPPKKVNQQDKPDKDWRKGVQDFLDK